MRIGNKIITIRKGSPLHIVLGVAGAAIIGYAIYIAYIAVWIIAQTR